MKPRSITLQRQSILFLIMLSLMENILSPFLRAISTTNSVNSGYSTEPTLTVFNQKAQDDADAAAEAA